MKRIYIYISIAFGLFISSCDTREGETVESAYLEPIIQPYKYKFSRNGNSSVDGLEQDLVNIPMDYIYQSYMKQARIVGSEEYEMVMRFFREEAEGGIVLEKEIASSSIEENNREQIVKDVLEMIDESAKISGYPAGVSSRGISASEGVAGYIGNDILDPNLAFVNTKGLAVSEVYKTMLLGAIHLDKILNKHLDESILDNADLKNRHENVELVSGKNYTELEHHWDLAYAYYSRWKPFAQPEGLIALKGSEEKILNAFVLGRYELGKYRYDEMKKHLRIIREELSRVVAIRAMSLLIGMNTLANLNEEPSYSFYYLSEAYGLIYTLQFTRKADGTPYFTYADIRELQKKLLKGNGFWEVNRLLSDSDDSLKGIAQQIGQPFQISLESIKR